MKLKRYARQGDVGIYLVEGELPEHLNFVKKESEILAVGEHHGAKHELVKTSKDVELWVAVDKDLSYLKVIGGEAKIIHHGGTGARHDTITLEPEKVYVRKIQVEYDPVVYRKNVVD